MSNLVEIFLIVLLFLLTVVILVVSWQVFFFFKELRQTRQRAEKLLDQLELVSQRLLIPVSDVGVAWRLLTHSGRLIKIIDKVLANKKDDRR